MLLCIQVSGVTTPSTQILDPQVLKLIQQNLPKMFWKRRQWCVVFITDEEERASDLRTKKYQGLENIGIPISIYSSVLDIEALG